MPLEHRPIRWGILGPGSIANAFAEGIRALPDGILEAVGSRSQQRADAFADKYSVPRRHGSYQSLVEDPDVDVIYVATPHPMHHRDCLLALQAGKPVLCEKPFAINRAEAARVVDEARQRAVFLMEGHWSRFFPAMNRLRGLVRDGAIGEPRLVEVDFGFRAGVDPKSRLFDPAMGGGALLDVGCYTLSFASMILGAPNHVEGLATLGSTGVDEMDAMILGYPSGALALMTAAIRTTTPWIATVNGTEGRIIVHTAWWKPESMTLLRDGKEPEEIRYPLEGSGFNYEAAEVQRCLRAGLLESPVMTWEETLSILGTMDTLRRQWGVRYPMEV